MNDLSQAARRHVVTWEDPATAAKAGLARDGIDYLRAIQRGELPAPPIANLLDMRIETVEPGRAVFVCVPQEFHYNPIGVVHGGVAATLLDTAMACAVHSVLPAGSGYTTLELKVNFVRGLTVQSGRVRAEGTLIHMGHRVATAEGRLTAEDGRLYAHATTTCMIFGPAGDPPSGDRR